MRTSTVAVLFFLSAIGAQAQESVPTAEAVLKPLYAQAKQEQKNVLLIFHASWCGWCRKMDSSLLDPGVRPLIDANFVTGHLTVYESKDKKHLENPGALALLTKHGGADEGLPYWVVLDKDGNLLANAEAKPGENTGCPANAAEVAYFISVLRKTSKLNDDQLKVVEQRFRMNEMK